MYMWEKYIFLSKHDLMMVLASMAILNNFEFKVHKSIRSLLSVRCIDSSCKWRIIARLAKSSNIFCIFEYVGDHSFNVDILNNYHRKATSWVIVNLIKDRLSGTGRTYKIRDEFDFSW